MIESDLTRPAPMVAPPPACDGDEQHAVQTAAEMPRRVVATEPRHPEIEQRHIRLEVVGGLDGADAVVRGQYHMSLEPQHLGQALRGILIVVHDENAATRM